MVDLCSTLKLCYKEKPVLCGFEFYVVDATTATANYKSISLPYERDYKNTMIKIAIDKENKLLIFTNSSGSAGIGIKVLLAKIG